MFGPPLAFGLSLAAVLRDEQKRFAIVMLVLASALMVYYLWITGVLRAWIS